MNEIKQILSENHDFYSGQANEIDTLVAVAQALEPGNTHLVEGDHKETAEQIGLGNLPDLPPAATLDDEAFATVTIAKDFIVGEYRKNPLIKKGVNTHPVSGEHVAQGLVLEGSNAYFNQYDIARSHREFKVLNTALDVPSILKSKANSVVVKNASTGEYVWSFRDVYEDGTTNEWSDPSTITVTRIEVEPVTLSTNSDWNNFSHTGSITVSPMSLNIGEDEVVDTKWSLYHNDELIWSFEKDPSQLTHTFEWGMLVNNATHVLIVQHFSENYGQSQAVQQVFKTVNAYVEAPTINIE